jgi:hypothetical protein
MTAEGFNPFAVDSVPSVPDVEANETPSEESEVPPDPGLLFHRDRYGRGVHGWTWNSEPVGLVLEREHKSLTGEQVTELLLGEGMPEGDAAWFGVQRTKAREATGALAETPALKSLAASDAAASERLARVRAAFLAKQGKK